MSREEEAVEFDPSSNPMNVPGVLIGKSGDTDTLLFKYCANKQAIFNGEANRGSENDGVTSEAATTSLRDATYEIYLFRPSPVSP